ncbi:cellulase family glycosylhydrolase [Saccharicrinis aurantiacus]|uniref:cellulase family glycosylhydrolase n=1 Tax=Saccharicrinis aurantiacus TaxID=1849719 RepID=UPI000837E64F|nr:cellulase family glycosylhydrolase [Saccharicrinis aurantiacus]
MRIIQLLSLLTCLLSQYACSPKNEAIITINPNNEISNNFIGNGVQWDAYPHASTENSDWGKLMTEDKWQMNYERLDYMQPKLLRVVYQANWRYLVGFDKANNPIVNFDTPEVEALEKILSYAQKNNMTVLLGEWGTPFHVHDVAENLGDKFSGANDPKWIDIIIESLQYFIIDKGYTCIKYYNLVNEPNGTWASTNGNFKEWSEGAQLLASKIRETGLAEYVSVAGPDAVTLHDNPDSEYTGIEWVDECAKQLDADMGIYEVHDYTSTESLQNGEFAKFNSRAAKYPLEKGKQIIFGELGCHTGKPENKARIEQDPHAGIDSQMDIFDYSYGIDMADAAIQAMNIGYSGTAAWALDDAMHTDGDLGDKNKLKRWGMWNSLGTELCNNPQEEEMRPWFYTWSLMCRYFPVGSSILKTEELDIDGVRLTAGISGDDLSIALVNTSETEQTFSIAIPNNTTFQRFLYIDGERSLDEDGFPKAIETNIKANKQITIQIPANSFVLYTSLDF